MLAFQHRKRSRLYWFTNITRSPLQYNTCFIWNSFVGFFKQLLTNTYCMKQGVNRIKCLKCIHQDFPSLSWIFSAFSFFMLWAFCLFTLFWLIAPFSPHSCAMSFGPTLTVACYLESLLCLMKVRPLGGRGKFLHVFECLWLCCCTLETVSRISLSQAGGISQVTHWFTVWQKTTLMTNVVFCYCLVNIAICCLRKLVIIRDIPSRTSS